MGFVVENNFGNQFRKATNNALRKIGKAFMATVKQVSKQMVDQTPLYFKHEPKTGTTKALWAMAVNKEPANPGKVTPDPSGRAAKSHIIEVVNNSKADKPELKGDITINLRNFAVWFPILEYGNYPKNPVYGSRNKQAGKDAPDQTVYPDEKGYYVIRSQGGFSMQAPQGIIALNVIEWNSILHNNFMKHVKSESASTD